MEHGALVRINCYATFARRARRKPGGDGRAGDGARATPGPPGGRRVQAAGCCPHSLRWWAPCWGNSRKVPTTRNRCGSAEQKCGPDPVTGPGPLLGQGRWFRADARSGPLVQDRWFRAAGSGPTLGQGRRWVRAAAGSRARGVLAGRLPVGRGVAAGRLEGSVGRYRRVRAGQVLLH